MAEIILVQPIVGLLDEVKNAPALPVSLLSAARLAAREFQVVIIDQRIERENWRRRLRQELDRKPLLVGTTAMLGPQIEWALAVSREVKAYAPAIPVVWGGTHASVLPHQTLQHPAVDMVVEGDGEETLLALAVALRDGLPLAAVAGLHYKQDAKRCSGPPRGFVELGGLPDLPYRLVELDRYLPNRMGKPTADVESSRGCPNRCAFCYNPQLNRRRWRALPADLVLERIAALRQRCAALEGVWFIDDELFVDLDRARKIIAGLAAMGLTWTVQGTTIRSVLAMDDDYIRMLVDSGCKQLNLGVESGVPRLLELMDKGITPDDVREVNRRLRGTGLNPWFYFVVGFPTETLAETRQTVAFAMELLDRNPAARISGIACYTPYPGTAMMDQARELGFVPPDRLEGWIGFATDQVNVPWLTGEHREIVAGLQFASFFADGKMEDAHYSWYVRLPGCVYRPLARYRMRSWNWKLNYEHRLGNWARKMIIGK